MSNKAKENHETAPKAAEQHHDGPKKSDHSSQPVSSPRPKHAEALPGNCRAWGCKAKSHQFEFCNEHFEHFKFGLIKKTGEQVPDYEKKIEHYLAYKHKQNVQKVA